MIHELKTLLSRSRLTFFEKCDEEIGSTWVPLVQESRQNKTYSRRQLADAVHAKASDLTLGSVEPADFRLSRVVWRQVK